MFTRHASKHSVFFSDEFVVTIIFHHRATLHDQNLVTVSDGVQSVRHCDDGTLLQLVAYYNLYGPFRAGMTCAVSSSSMTTLLC